MNHLLENDDPIYHLIAVSDTWKNDQWQVFNYEENDIICKYHEIYPYFSVLLEGEINIYHTSEKGKTYSQSIYKAGSYFGELEIFDELPYVCEIKALTKVTLIRLHKKNFEDWIKKDNDITLYLLKSLCRTSYALSKKAIEDTLYSLKFRICDYLIGRYEEKGLSLETFSMSKSLISERFVVTTRSINRILKSLADKQFIEVNRDQIKILNLDALKRQRDYERF